MTYGTNQEKPNQERLAFLDEVIQIRPGRDNPKRDSEITEYEDDDPFVRLTNSLLQEVDSENPEELEGQLADAVDRLDLPPELEERAWELFMGQSLGSAVFSDSVERPTDLQLTLF